jgi:hypothetical protein
VLMDTTKKSLCFPRRFMALSANLSPGWSAAEGRADWKGEETRTRCHRSTMPVQQGGSTLGSDQRPAPSRPIEDQAEARAFRARL